MALNDTMGATRRETPVVADDGRGVVDWGAIVAGAVLATAISFVLATFGASLGLSLTSAREGEGLSLMWLTIAAGVWFVWVSVSSFGAGGYLAGRLRRRRFDASAEESETRDGAHGLVVWAVGAILGAMLAGSGLGALGSAAAGAAEEAADAAGGAAGAAASTIGQEELDYISGGLFRTGAAAGPADPRVAEEAAALFGRALTEGEMPEADRAWLARLVAESTGLDEAAARARVDAAATELQQAADAAVETAEDARVAGVITGFFVAATLLVSAVAAHAAAQAGGRHRDENLAFAFLGASASARTAP